MENMEIEPNKNYLLYYTKYHPYISRNNNIENENYDMNEDENNNNNTSNGRWSQKEQLSFIKGCLLYGINWKKIQNYIQTRSCSQIRSHSQKYFHKLYKKYKTDNLNNILNKDELDILVNKNKFNNKDMENAEKYILTLFNGNKDKAKDKDIFEDNDENNFNFVNKNKKSMKKEIKEKIFDISKIPKEEKIKKSKIEEEKEDSSRNDSEKENEDLNKMNDDAEYEEENNSYDKKIFKKDILADKEDTEIISQKEEFINKCLDSKDPKDLVNLLKYFGNDINFKVNDINILKKYQYYLGLDLNNYEEINDENSKEANNINNTNNNAYYPYIITPSGNGIQFNPLYNPTIVFNPQIVNQS
jgi:SHAQKYF class myb-like DNA-binding protein